jgi:hypothetical protein
MLALIKGNRQVGLIISFARALLNVKTLFLLVAVTVMHKKGKR